MQQSLVERRVPQLSLRAEITGLDHRFIQSPLSKRSRNYLYQFEAGKYPANVVVVVVYALKIYNSGKREVRPASFAIEAFHRPNFLELSETSYAISQACTHVHNSHRMF